MEEVKTSDGVASEKEQYLTKHWNLPAQNKNFIGRQNLLDQISERLSGSKPLVITACHGLGGVGKTQLVTEFAYRNEKKYERVIWVPAESSDQIETAYLSLGQDLGIIPEKTLPAEAILMVKAWLTKHPRNLIIFDNAPDNKTVEGYELSSGADILITSRNKDWEGGLAVDLFSLEEAVLYFRKIVGGRAEDTKEKIEELAEELGRLPLALAQAAAYIRQNKISIQAYLDLYHAKKAYFLLQSVLPEGDQHVSVYVTWDITMEEIQHKSAMAVFLLKVCSYLHSERIPAFLLEPFCDAEDDDTQKDVFEEVQGYLHDYSMVSVNEQDSSLSVHRLVQEVTQLKLVELEKTHYLEMIFTMCVLLFPNGEGEDRFEHLKLKRILLPHFEVLLDWVEGDDDKLMELLRCLQSAYGELGDVTKKKTVLERELSLREKNYPKDHYQIAITLVNLGSACGELGDAHKKKELLEHALPILEMHYGNNDPQIPKILNSLGNAYGDLNDVQKKKELLERSLSIDEMHYGKEDYHTATTWVNLGDVYGKLGEVQKKKELLECALPVLEKYYGKEHPYVAKTLANLASAYGQLNDVQKKKELLEGSLSMLENHYGKDHYEVAKVLTNLGYVFGELGNVQKKKECFESALPILEKHYGQHHKYVNSINDELEKMRARSNVFYLETYGSPVHSPRRKSSFSDDESTLIDSEGRVVWRK